MDDLKQLKLVKNIYIVMSLLFCVLGIFLMARPKSSVKMLCVLMGIMLILYGAIKISGYFTRDAFCLAFQFDLAFGILLMAVGVIRSGVVVADPADRTGHRSDRSSGFYQTI